MFQKYKSLQTRNVYNGLYSSIFLPIIKLHFFIFLFFLNSCQFTLLEDDPNAFTPDKAQDVNGAYYSITSAFRDIFDAHQKMSWVAGLVGNEEIEIINTAIAPEYAVRIQTEKTLARDNLLNRQITQYIYEGLALIENAKQAMLKNKFSTKGKALYLANLYLAEGVAYGDLSRFYENIIEYGTAKKISPKEARDRAIAALLEARDQFKTAESILAFTTERTTGLFVTTPIAQRFCNSYIAMLYYDSGEKDKAASYLNLGYIATDATRELGILNQNTAIGTGVLPEWRLGVEQQFNGYSQSFVDNRILGDTLRRLPRNWYLPAKNIALADNRVAMNYFYPQAPYLANPIMSATVSYYPLISWQEVVIMKADPDIAAIPHGIAVEQVLISWKIPIVRARNMVIPLAQLALYEYAGRGRRWAAVGTYPRWQVAKELE